MDDIEESNWRMK